MAWLYKQKGSSHWWLGYRIGKKQILRSTGTDDRAQAEKEKAKIEAISNVKKAGVLTEEFYRLLTNTESAQSKSLHAALELWIAECKSLSPVTLKRYRDVTDRFCIFIQSTPDAPLLRDIGKESVAAYLRDKRAKTSAANTKLNLKILASFFNWACANDELKDSPVPSAASLKLNGESEKIRRAFSLVEIQNLLKKAPNDFWKYMILAGYFLGQRLGDLICLRWGNVDFEQNLVRLTTSKTDKSLSIPLHPELAAFLSHLRRNAGNVKASDAIWPEQAERYAKFGSGPFSNEFYTECLVTAGLATPRSHQKTVTANGDEANGSREVNAISFHSLRHSFVSLLKITGASQSTAKELAGHSSDRMSDHYTHIDGETMTKAINRLPALTGEAIEVETTKA